MGLAGPSEFRRHGGQTGGWRSDLGVACEFRRHGGQTVGLL